jgi:hypothetical protein
VSAAAILGIALYSGVLLAVLWVLLRQSRASGLVAPLLVALCVRLTVMVVAHLVSVSHGDRGFFYLDDRGYDEIGRRIAYQWRQGHLIDIESSRYAGSLLFGYDALVGGIYTLVGNHVIAVKLVNVLLGAASVLLAAELAGGVLGAAAERPVAWLVALWPTLVWWSSTMLKESLVGFLLLVTLVAAFRLYRLRGLAAAAAAFVALAITRMPATIAVVITLAVGLGLAAFRRRHEVDWRALGIFGSGGLALLLISAVAIGYGHPHAFLNRYRYTFHHITHFYGTGKLVNVPLDVGRTLAMPHPWIFDVASRTWDRALYPGMWLWYALLPMAALGAWRLRRQLDALLLVLPIVLLLVLNAFLVGPAFRQRSTFEPLVLVLITAGFASFQRLALVVSAGLLVAAASALFQTHAHLVAALIAGGAIALAALSRILPSDDRSLPVKRNSDLESCVVSFKPPSPRHRWSPRQGTLSSRPKHPV